MYLSLIFSFCLVPIFGPGPVAAIPTDIRSRTNTALTGRILSGSIHNTTYAPKIQNISNSTKALETVNYFPNPVVHCSGRTLSGDSNWMTDLDTAVISSTTSGIYGTCDVDGSEVDGDGVLAWKSGQVQVYYCNHGFTPQDCSLNEYWRADDLINDSCGSDGGGWVTISDWKKTIGRDPTNSDGSFRSECGASLHGVSANIVIDI
ncbi:hypothetical protein VP1G_11210 [Cytospora mali]|uniref:Cyanovirin-N domain-containing protein n=1 Tax=Cytospora mali TaxID=578113 RepID=A0A194V808_CYTMA|nr:hypothetical protein VP1G_11210 [Valsa mali var. pyri (nom. inval.)]